MQQIIHLLSTPRFDLQSEKLTQSQIMDALLQNNRETIYSVKREYRLDSRNVIDFLVNDSIGIEVKLKGSRRAIYLQCARYCEFDQVQELILVTNRAMALPHYINDKPCAVVNLGMAWL